MGSKQLNLCVIFELICLFSVGFGTSDLNSSESKTFNPTPTPNPDPVSVPILARHFKGIPNYFKALEIKNEQREKTMQEQFKLLKDEIEQIKNQLGLNQGGFPNPNRAPSLSGTTSPGKNRGNGQVELSNPQEIKSKGNSELSESQSINDFCNPVENWVTLDQHNNTNSFDEIIQFNATVGLQQQQSLQNEPSNSSSENSREISSSNLQKIFSTRIGKSKPTGFNFNWTLASSSVWTDETTVNKTYTCREGSSCVLKQLVGQCENFRVPVDQFCLVSVPLGSPIPDSCNTNLESRRLTSCSDAMEILPSSRSTKQWIHPHGNSRKNKKQIEVLCDFEQDGGGWTVIQKRTSGPQNDFDRTWNEYAEGFGSVDGNFWVGLDNIRALTKNEDQELRIDVEDFEGNKAYAKYSRFSISGASDYYRLSIGRFTAGTADDNFRRNDNMRFSTKDADHDGDLYRNCAELYPGGWWFDFCSPEFNLNGLYREKGEDFPRYQGIMWGNWKRSTYSLAKTEMKIRKRK